MKGGGALPCRERGSLLHAPELKCVGGEDGREDRGRRWFTDQLQVAKLGVHQCIH